MVVGDDDKGDENMFIMSDGEDFSMPTMIVEEEPGAVIVKPLTELDGRSRIDTDNFALAEDIYEEVSDDEKDGDILGWEEAYEQEV